MPHTTEHTHMLTTPQTLSAARYHQNNYRTRCWKSDQLADSLPTPPQSTTDTCEMHSSTGGYRHQNHCVVHMQLKVCVSGCKVSAA